MHKLGNVLIDVDGPVAHAETYAIAHHITESEEPGKSTDLVMGVRYLDRLEERRGEWKIAHREMCFEWERTTPTHDQALLRNFKRGLRDGSDPVLGWRQDRIAPDRVPDASTRPPRRVSNPSPSRTELEELDARSSIQTLLLESFQSVDRRNLSKARRTYAVDAVVDHGTYRGGIDGLLANLRVEVYSRFRITMHKVGQILIELADGANQARAESYLVCHHIETTTGTPEPGLDKTDLVIGLRSLDLLEQRDGQWRIKEREIRFEWIRTDPLEPLDPDWTLGRADEHDPSQAGAHRTAE